MGNEGIPERNEKLLKSAMREMGIYHTAFETVWNLCCKGLGKYQKWGKGKLSTFLKNEWFEEERESTF